MQKIIAISGGFDPLHIGHLEMMNRACNLGRLVVILNSDEWLMRKKNYVFMSWDERKELIQAIKYVDMVVGVDDSDGSVCKALEMLRPDYFGNGGDRKEDNILEYDLCEKLDIEMIFGLGPKIQSSSDLIIDAAQNFINKKGKNK